MTKNKLKIFQPQNKKIIKYKANGSYKTSLCVCKLIKTVKNGIVTYAPANKNVTLKKE